MYRAECPVNAAWKFRKYAVIRHEILYDPELIIVDKDTDIELIKISKEQLLDKLKLEGESPSRKWISTVLDSNEHMSTNVESIMDISSENKDKVIYVRMLL